MIHYLQHGLEKIANWKAQLSLSVSSAVVGGASINDAASHGAVELYHWVATGVSFFAASVAAASLVWKIYTWKISRDERTKDHANDAPD